MTAAWIAVVSAVAALVTAIGAAVAVVLQRRQDRNKPALDKSNTDVAQTTVAKMVKDLNRDRDIRLWQLEGYVDLDRTWHRKMIGLTETLIELLIEAQAAGFTPSTAIPDATQIPAPPDIPEPPHA